MKKEGEVQAETYAQAQLKEYIMSAAPLTADRETHFGIWGCFVECFRRVWGNIHTGVKIAVDS
jgi:hypothetical protein